MAQILTPNDLVHGPEYFLACLAVSAGRVMRDFQFLGHLEQPGAVLATSAQYGVEKARVFLPLKELYSTVAKEGCSG